MPKPHTLPTWKCLRRGGFTLIEVLVVVAIIALLISILLPSLSRAREQARMVMCEAHLKQFGNALNMYMMDAKDTLPGPLHPAMLKNTRYATPAQKTFYLPLLLRKYFAENIRGSGSMADALATCPSFPVKDEAFSAVWGPTAGPNPFHYCINSWTNTCAGCNGSDPNSSNDLDYYFGFTHAGITDYASWKVQYSQSTYDKNGISAIVRMSPKKLTRIKFPYKEYAIAEAFRRPYASEDATLNTNLPRGSWPRIDDVPGNSGNVLPKSPFHLGSGHQRKGATWEYQGRCNTLYFDWHVDSQRGFDRFIFNRDRDAL